MYYNKSKILKNKKLSIFETKNFVIFINEDIKFFFKVF